MCRPHTCTPRANLARANVDQVGVAADLEQNYLARICQLFGLRHVQVTCATAGDDVGVGDFHGVLSGGGEGSEEVGCAAEVRRAIAALVASQAAEKGSADAGSAAGAAAGTAACSAAGAEEAAGSPRARLRAVLAALPAGLALRRLAEPSDPGARGSAAEAAAEAATEASAAASAAAAANAAQSGLSVNAGQRLLWGASDEHVESLQRLLRKALL